MSHFRDVLGAGRAAVLAGVTILAHTALSLKPLGPEIVHAFAPQGDGTDSFEDDVRVIVASRSNVTVLLDLHGHSTVSGANATAAKHYGHSTETRRMATFDPRARNLTVGANRTASIDTNRARPHALHGIGNALRQSFMLATRRHNRSHREPTDEVTPLPVPEQSAHGLLDFILGCIFMAFALMGLQDLYRFSSMRRANKAIGDETHKAGQLSSDTLETDKNNCHRNWSAVGLLGLTAYRFYTGFLSATWLPYLLAMEGEDLWRQNQSLFMGVAKLIYGVTILINPIMGRIGDRAVIVSHGLGRRIFVRLGVTISAIGIFICLGAARHHYFYSFLFGILTWRLGEAINDVTTEAIIPEMVPLEQFQLAGSIKAASFLLGGLLGYVLLIEFVDWHYSWLYYAYLIGMLTCAMPAFLLLDKDELPVGLSRSRPQQESLGESMLQAYFVPTQAEGGFPRFCLATFVFTLGTAPVFFLLLMVRDLLGVTDPTDLQTIFSWTSIVFFISAAVASIISGIGAPKRTSSDAQADGGEVGDDNIRHRWRLLVWTQMAFGFVTLLMPSVVLLGSTDSRVIGFFSFAIVFGALFGSGYSRFQEATWQVLPNGERGRANAMGFNTMCRLLGVGIGNFAVGLLLDFFYTGNNLPQYHTNPNPDSTFTIAEVAWQWFSGNSDQQVYKTQGYVIMCTACCICNVLSGLITSTIQVSRNAG